MDRKMIVGNCCCKMTDSRDSEIAIIGSVIITLSELGWKNESY